MLKPGLTILNLYHLTASAADFSAAISALAARVEAEGHPGVLSYRFFVNPGEQVARAVVDYADGAAWIGHHDLSMKWPEMKALHAVAALAEVCFLGPFTDDIRDWLAGSTLKAKLNIGYQFAAGFQRD